MSKSKSSQNVEEKYSRMDLHEHILKRPDSYVGSIKTNKQEMYIFDSVLKTMKKKKIMYNQGFYKTFDEIRVNAWDRTVKSDCDTIKVDLNMETGWISVTNTNDCPDIRKHQTETYIDKKTGKTENIYIPHMIFGMLLTSENYKSKGKITGGKNGYGAKCTNIYSKEFIVEAVDCKQKIKYFQTFRNNMYDFDSPKITSCKDKESYCKISYLPDYEKFGMKGLTKDMHGVIVKACYDLLVSSTKKIKVYLDGEQLKIKDFKDYIKLYYPTINEKQIVHEKINSRWDVSVVFVPDLTFSHISFVNGIYTKNGGTHVEYITDQVVKGVKSGINSKKKYKTLNIRPTVIKDHLHIFISSIIEDPDFESQTKETLTTKVDDFGEHKHSKCKLDDKFIKNILNSGLEDEVVKMAEFKANNKLSSNDGKKVAKVYDPKLSDASWAGTNKSDQCCLILTEGDSAATFALWGLNVIGREKYGVFPLKGVPINVSQTNTDKLLNNEEFSKIKQHMGLKQNLKYDNETDIKKLRYGGGIIILTDQDPDGSHIKGLIMLMFQHFWPHLAKREGFIKTLNTPLLIARKGKEAKIFYNKAQYDKWKSKKELLELKKWHCKYYKGLGSSKQNEAEECFESFDDKKVVFVEKKDGENSEEINDDNPLRYETLKMFKLLFAKKETDNRKEWLNHYDPEEYLDTLNKKVTYNDFFDKEYRAFSKYSCKRAVPSIMDGWKPSQRKIYYCMVKRGRNASELKVAQLSGYVSEHAEYHHGEASLQGAIINMAQNFPGSNNINILYPDGNFGTRRDNGNDSASARYIHTYLEKIMEKIFRPEDDNILNYINEEGHSIEPEYYGGIIPMCLVNGVNGIGTGWSSNIPSFNPKDIINNIRRKLKGKSAEQMKPWYKGYPSENIIKKTDVQYICEGVFEIDNNKVIIKNIPIGQKSKSIISYTKFLYELLEQDRNGKKNEKKTNIIDIEEKCGTNTVYYEVLFNNGSLNKLLEDNCKELIKLLHLECNINLTNMTLHNVNGEIVKYESVEQIIDEFYIGRYEMYKTRREYRLKELKNRLNIIDYKIKYIEHVNDETIIVKKITIELLIKRLEELKYPKLNNDHTCPKEECDYTYLTNMRITSLTTDEIKRLKEERDKRKKELNDYTNATIEDLWNRELDELEKEYDIWLPASLAMTAESDKSNKSNKSKKSNKSNKSNKSKKKK